MPSTYPYIHICLYNNVVVLNHLPYKSLKGIFLKNNLCRTLDKTTNMTLMIFKSMISFVNICNKKCDWINESHMRMQVKVRRRESRD